MNYIKKFEDIRLSDVPVVGGKTASLGEMLAHLSGQGVRVPTGFAITSAGYWRFLEYNNLKSKITTILAELTDLKDTQRLQLVGARIRALIEQGIMPDDLAQEIKQAYKELSAQYHVPEVDVAVRSSATAEDLPDASFAGQQETFLNVHGSASLLEHCKKSFASLFTDRAIIYRAHKGFDQTTIALSTAVQKMVRSDLACSGVAFSLDTETGFKDAVVINGSWGLGETIVQGSVTPDEFVVFKPTLQQGFIPIIKKKLGEKDNKLIYTNDAGKLVQMVAVDQQQQHMFCLSDTEIIELAKATVVIENYYSQLKSRWCPMDIEWAKDGNDGLLYIVQARPETIFSAKQQSNQLVMYNLQGGFAQYADSLVATGQSIGQKIVVGTARVIQSVADINTVQQGDIIVTEMTDPAWVPAMKKAAGIITNRGGRTCHAAIVSRELGITAVVGCVNATATIKDGTKITLDCSRGAVGYVYAGELPFENTVVAVDTLPHIPAQLLVNCAEPDTAFATSMLPVDGVGLARIEFIITNSIKVHPMALLHPEKVADAAVRTQIDTITAPYPDKKTFFIDTLAHGVGMIAAAFYPKKVVVRFSDFKSNEYRNLLGGSYFEEIEENPMIGFRGASRYYNTRYQEAFALECAAMKKARNEMGFTNIALMLPFVRTVNEAHKVTTLMAQHGLERGKDKLDLIMMVEIPSNVLLIDQFSKQFDGFSIGSNDLTQLTLGVDRDSELLAELFDERDAAVQMMLDKAVDGAHAHKRPIGICGQAPSDYPEVAHHLLERGIDSLSLNADAVIPFLMRYKK